VILGSFRLLYFFIPVRAMGPLVLSMLRMYIDVLYFIMLLVVMIVGFAAAFNLIYGGIAPELTGFWMAMYTCLTVAYNQQYFVDNDEFVPLAIYWFGDIIMVAYFVLSAILLINLLIAMMSTTYNNLMGDKRRTQGEWRVEFGDLVLHYERFLIIPPPFNLVQFFLFICAFLFRYKGYRDFLFGDWTSRDRAIGKLLRDKNRNHPHLTSQKFQEREIKLISKQISQKESSIWQTIKKIILFYAAENEDTQPTEDKKPEIPKEPKPKKQKKSKPLKASGKLSKGSKRIEGSDKEGSDKEGLDKEGLDKEDSSPRSSVDKSQNVPQIEEDYNPPEYSEEETSQSELKREEEVPEVPPTQNIQYSEEEQVVYSD